MTFWKQPIAGHPRPYDPWRDAGECTFDEARAERVTKYWESTFTLKDGAFEGRPFKLLDWQKQMIGHLFGWQRPDGTRRFRKAFLYIPKKNGKTQLGAGIGLLLFHADGEDGAEVYSAASESGQSKIIWDAAARMIDKDDKLSRAIDVFKGYRAFHYQPRNAYWKVLSARADSKHGPNVHGLLIDELHTLKDAELVETLEAGMISRRQPMEVIMTTAGATGETLCNRELRYAEGVRDGEIPDRYYLPVIFNGQEDYDQDSECWKSPEFWAKVNPSLGVTIQKDWFEAEVNKCEVDQSHAPAVKRLHLNIQTDAATQWLSSQDWAACGGEIEPEGVCYGGMDLASTNDLTAFALYWPATNSVRVEIYCPENTAASRAEYQLWKEASERFHVTPGRRTDYAYMREDIRKLSEKYDLRMIGYDRWNADQLVQQLANEDEHIMVEVGQGYRSMNLPSKELERLLLGHELQHENDPVLNWMAGNVHIKEDPTQSIKPVKESRNSREKIDGIIAMIVAMAVANGDLDDEPEEGMPVIVI
jgi:phage terminase large subunit-like protein